MSSKKQKLFQREKTTDRKAYVSWSGAALGQNKSAQTRQKQVNHIGTKPHPAQLRSFPGEPHTRRNLCTPHQR